jgi:N-acetylglucosamine-6-sulfatase
MTGTQRPNIVLIIADDLDVASVPEMPRLTQLAAERGVTCTRHYITTPICCPSRASILRGQYAHNHSVLANNREHGGFHTFYLKRRERSTIATWLNDAGYRTALVGKYLNGYPKLPKRYTDETIPHTYIPPGWDGWWAQLGRGASGGPEYSLNESGAIVDYDERQLADYSTDVFARHALRFIDRAIPLGSPFFLYLATIVPHYPANPAPRHAALFPDAQAPRPPSYDEPDVSDKPAYIRDAPRLSREQVVAIDDQYADRLRSLQSLYETIEQVIASLDSHGVADHSYVIITSDHGWHLGEHRLPFGKETPYEESIRAPLIVIGPGLATGQTVDVTTLNIDLAPTIAELVGVTPPAFVDGRSIAPFLRGQTVEPWRQSFLVEHLVGGSPISYPDLGTMPQVPTYRALRSTMVSDNRIYVEYEGGDRELYNITADPYELENVAAAAVTDALASQVEALRTCAGASCRSIEDGTVAGVPDRAAAGSARL